MGSSRASACRWLPIAVGSLLGLALIARVVFWDVVERIWLRLQFRGRYESFRLNADHVDDTFVLHVCLPRGYDATQGYPVVYVLDGDSDALPMAGVVAHVGVAAIVVGVGYGRAEEDARERDYTPFVAPEIDWAPSGSGAAFYGFLTEELFPEVEARYPTLGADHRVLAGHSLAGLATVYALLRDADAQRNLAGYIAASPTLPLADGEIFALERDLAETKAERRGALFLSVGGRESAEMQEAMTDLAAIFRRRGYPGLTVRMKVRRGRGHGGNNWRSYIDGVRWMGALGILDAGKVE